MWPFNLFVRRSLYDQQTCLKLITEDRARFFRDRAEELAQELDSAETEQEGLMQKVLDLEDQLADAPGQLTELEATVADQRRTIQRQETQMNGLRVNLDTVRADRNRLIDTEKSRLQFPADTAQQEVERLQAIINDREEQDRRLEPSFELRIMRLREAMQTALDNDETEFSPFNFPTPVMPYPPCPVEPCPICESDDCPEQGD